MAAGRPEMGKQLACAALATSLFFGTTRDVTYTPGSSTSSADMILIGMSGGSSEGMAPQDHTDYNTSSGIPLEYLPLLDAGTSDSGSYTPLLVFLATTLLRMLLQLMSISKLRSSLILLFDTFAPLAFASIFGFSVFGDLWDEKPWLPTAFSVVIGIIMSGPSWWVTCDMRDNEKLKKENTMLRATLRAETEAKELTARRASQVEHESSVVVSALVKGREDLRTAHRKAVADLEEKYTEAETQRVNLGQGLDEALEESSERFEKLLEAKRKLSSARAELSSIQRANKRLENECNGVQQAFIGLNQRIGDAETQAASWEKTAKQMLAEKKRFEEQYRNLAGLHSDFVKDSEMKIQGITFNMDAKLRQRKVQVLELEHNLDDTQAKLEDVLMNERVLRHQIDALRPSQQLVWDFCELLGLDGTDLCDFEKMSELESEIFRMLRANEREAKLQHALAAERASAADMAEERSRLQGQVLRMKAEWDMMMAHHLSRELNAKDDADIYDQYVWMKQTQQTIPGDEWSRLKRRSLQIQSEQYMLVAHETVRRIDYNDNIDLYDHYVLTKQNEELRQRKATFETYIGQWCHQLNIHAASPLEIKTLEEVGLRVKCDREVVQLLQAHVPGEESAEHKFWRIFEESLEGQECEALRTAVKEAKAEIKALTAQMKTLTTDRDGFRQTWLEMLEVWSTIFGSTSVFNASMLDYALRSSQHVERCKNAYGQEIYENLGKLEAMTRRAGSLMSRVKSSRVEIRRLTAENKQLSADKEKMAIELFSKNTMLDAILKSFYSNDSSNNPNKCRALLLIGDSTTSDAQVIKAENSRRKNKRFQQDIKTPLLWAQSNPGKVLTQQLETGPAIDLDESSSEAKVRAKENRRKIRQRQWLIVALVRMLGMVGEKASLAEALHAIEIQP